MTVNIKNILDKALEGHYAVPALNTQGGNYDMTWAICKAAEEKGSPIILAHYDTCSAYAGLDFFVEISKWCANKVSVPVAVHLDHGATVELCKRAVDLGCTSVMFDGSAKPLQQNIEETAQVIEYAHAHGATVEAEIGCLSALAGSGADSVSRNCADFDEIVQFVRAVRPDALAIAIGNAHGFYAEKPKLNFELLKRAREITDIPFVLHGGTGIPTEDIRRAIREGICKVNIGTEIRCGYLRYMKEGIMESSDSEHIWKIEKKATERMIEDVKSLIDVCGSEGKA